MAGILLQAADDRVLGPSTFVLIHEIRSGSHGPISTLSDELEFLKALENRGVTILAERSSLSEEEIREKSGRRDWWMDAPTAVALGFADRIA